MWNWWRGSGGSVFFAYPPLEGEGRLALSEAKCETGWGDSLSTHALLAVERPSPHLAARFARDARILIDAGYRIDGVTPVDQFRHTPHVELVARFRR